MNGSDVSAASHEDMSIVSGVRVFGVDEEFDTVGDAFSTDVCEDVPGFGPDVGTFAAEVEIFEAAVVVLNAAVVE